MANSYRLFRFRLRNCGAYNRALVHKYNFHLNLPATQGLVLIVELIELQLPVPNYTTICPRHAALIVFRCRALLGRVTLSSTQRVSRLTASNVHDSTMLVALVEDIVCKHFTGNVREAIFCVLEDFRQR